MGHRTRTRLLGCLHISVAAWRAPALLEAAGLPAVKAKLSGHYKGAFGTIRAAEPPSHRPISR